jgi:hypothetical protein
MYIVGTDESGGGDFNVMRELLISETPFTYPAVAVTFDFRAGKIRKTWRRSRADAPTLQEFTLGTRFRIVYEDIARVRDYGTLRHLHLLAHFGDDRVFFRPHSGSSAAEFADLAPQFRLSFAPDAIVKVHGCQHDDGLIERLRAFCTNGASGAQLLTTLRRRIERSYPLRLSAAAGVPVWAAPLGAGALYQCRYLAAGEQGRRFCIEVTPGVDFSDHNAVRFYEANYDRIFARGPSEEVFDRTFHMKYKPQLRTQPAAVAPCAAAVPSPH